MKYNLSFEDFLDVHYDDLATKWYEEGYDQSFDYSRDQFEEEQYEDYCKRVGSWANCA